MCIRDRRKAGLITELLGQFGLELSQAERREYAEIALSANAEKIAA